MNLQEMLIRSRLTLRDLGVKKVSDFFLIRSANEGKNELRKLIGQAKQDFFVTSANGTITTAAPSNPSTIALPADFSQLRDITVTQDGYQSVSLMKWDRNDVVFKYHLRTTFSWTTGSTGTFFYDIVGLGTMHLVPATAVTMTCVVTYVQEVADLALLTDAPSAIPAEHHDFIPTWMITEALRSVGDARLASYTDKLKMQGEQVAASVGVRALNEPQAE